MALILAAASLPAGTLSDADTTVLVHHGDSLVFELYTGNFQFNAARYGLPLYPTQVDLSLTSTPIADGTVFSGWLESPDGSASIRVSGYPTFSPGVISSSQYSGPVSVLEGTVYLSIDDSAAIFGAGLAELRLLNLGEDITVGLPPASISQDLRVCLSGGPLSVGAVTLSASLNASQGFEAIRATGFAAVPEPSSTLLALAGGVFVCRRRIRRALITFGT